jgi:lipopolysaccharide export system protein LptC
LSTSLRFALFATVLVAAVLGSWYLTQSQPRPPDELTDTESDESYYMRDATLLGIGDNGIPSYRVHAAYIRHIALDDSIELTNIRVRFEADPDVPWTLNAPRGQIPKERGYIDLIGEVTASREPDEGDELVIVTSDVRVLLEDRIATTAALVTMNMGPHAVTARGMRAYLKQDRVELQSDVNGLFAP